MRNAQGNPIIEFQGVGKKFGGFHALSQIDLTVARGERVVICGPSGSGKSTLVRCINQLEKPDSGKIIVDSIELGTNKKDLKLAMLKTGMVFQQFNLFSNLNILENLTLGLIKTKKTDLASANSIAMAYLERVKIPEKANAYPEQLSGGQRQRVAIARALCMGPEIMLFDEPTSALDAEMVREILDLMIEVAEDGMTMICVTHEMGFAKAFADRVIFMDCGSLIESAPPSTIFSAPQHQRTRQFFEKIM